jgi:predicted Ser/Thr protein kinase
MHSSLTCLSDEQLDAVAAGEEPTDDVRAHLAECSHCRERLKRIKDDIALFRRAAHFAGLPPLTMSDLTSETGLSDGGTDGPATDASVTQDGDESSAALDILREIDPDFPFGDDNSDAEKLPGPIGKYLVIGQFPPGGQAEVFRVVHPGLAKDLVLKLSLHPVQPGVRHEIIEEAKILAEFKHANLVQIYDLDFHDDRPYLVMEYIRGRNLDQVAREGRLRPRQAATLLAKVATAADYAHRRGIVHRDIKPMNILVDESGEPRLIDFGMARLRHAWSEDPGKPGGTFAFMAPEQARLESPEEQSKVGSRSDVFALGAVLYFLMTGKAPFEGQTWRESWDRARRCDFDRNALDDPKIPRDLRRICLKAMAEEPAERFASAAELRKALQRYLMEPIVRGAAAGVAGLALLAVLVHQVSRRVVDSPAPSPPASYIYVPTPGPAPIPASPQPMKGRIDLLVVKSKDGTRRRLRLADRGAVPVRAGDEIRIEARLDRPAYLYLFWLGSEGMVAPLYPWKDHDWSNRPAEERKVTAIEVPEVADDVLTIPASPAGLETLVLLAREDSALPLGEEQKLAADLAGPPVQMPKGFGEAVWLEDGQEVVYAPSMMSIRAERGEADLSRGIPSPKTRKSDDPVLRVRAVLKEKVQPLGGYSQAVLFPNEGG